MTLCLGNELIMPKIYAVLYKENFKKKLKDKTELTLEFSLYLHIF